MDFANPGGYDPRAWHAPKLTVLDVGDDTDGVKNTSVSENGAFGPS